MFKIGMSFHANLALKSLIVLLLIVNSECDDTKSTSRPIRFYYYPGKSTSERIELDENSLESIVNSGIAARDQLKIVVHGIRTNCSDGTSLTLLSGYTQANYEGLAYNNIICIDYGPLVTTQQLISTFGKNWQSVIDKTFTAIDKTLSATTKLVGNRVAEPTLKLLKTLLELNVIKSFDEIHIIAHSLGSHVAGIIGWSVQLEWGSYRKLGRISGLDPGATVDGLDLDYQLDLSDAKFVDVIHTNAGTESHKFGLGGKYGHVDFYPDGGSRQTVCREKENLFERFTGFRICSHTIVGKYWKESVLISKSQLTACEAQSWKVFQELKAIGVCNFPEVIGEYTSMSARGRYYLEVPRNHVTV